jgi:segregation and condensation protein A
VDAAAYRVKLEAFEGPLDLLLHLVKNNEVDIYNLPIATITDQYLEYVDLFQELNLDVAGEYLVMAATLIYAKSRLLLPHDEAGDEEEGEEDPATDLVRQLADYQRYREAAEMLTDRARLGRDVFRRDPLRLDQAELEDPGLKPVELPDLFVALRAVLARAAQRKPHTVEAEHHSVADAVRGMVDRLRIHDRVEFSTLFSTESSRGLIIATFCGMLEMIKLRIIAVEQDASVQPIYVRLVEKDVDDAVLRLVETYGHGEFHDLAAGGAAATSDADGAGGAAQPGENADAPETT